MLLVAPVIVMKSSSSSSSLLLLLMMLIVLCGESEAMTVVIAGGGIIGTSTAYYLATDHNTPVTIIDPVGIAACASGKAGGFLARDWRDSTPVEELHRYGFDLHQSLADDLQADYDIGYRRLTCEAVSVDESKEVMKPPSKKLKDVEWVDKGVIGSIPMGSEENIAQVHPQKLCRAMFDVATKKVGTELVVGRVVRAVVDKNATDNYDGGLVVKGVELEDGRIIPATQLVIACGPWTSEARYWFDTGDNSQYNNATQELFPEITGVKCHSILVKSPNRILNQAVFFESDGKLGDGDLEVYPRPDFDCYVNGFPGEETIMVEKPGQEVIDDDAIQLLIGAMNQTSSEIGGLEPHTKQVCFWPESSTGLPVIGQLGPISGAFIATGHSVWGILQGPATGKAMAELVVNKKASCVDLTPFMIESLPGVNDEGDPYSDYKVLGVRGGHNGLRDSSLEETAVLDDIKNVVETSKKANSNIEMAEKAVFQWEHIFACNDDANIPPNVLALCRQLYAACLARVGRDGDAISIYDACLSQKNARSLEDVITSRLGKAHCLQRLLRYEEAMAEFIEVMDTDEKLDGKLKAAWSAALSALRLGYTAKAAKICSDGLEATASLGLCTEVLMLKCLLSCVKYLQGEKQDDTVIALKDALLKWSSIGNSNTGFVEMQLSRSMKLLFTCILASLSTQNNSSNDKNQVKKNPSLVDAQNLFLLLVQINSGPFDDPDLGFLDDKIELHDLLTSDNNDSAVVFWPQTFVTPKDNNLIEQKTQLSPSNLWISKSRAGYGSHGNKIFSAEGLRQFGYGRRDSNGAALLQMMVDDQLLLDQRKFSLRIYCVYFSSTVAYIASEGLVKLAAVPFTDGSSLDASVHLTNSGRANNMSQFGLDFLWAQLDKDQTHSDTPSKETWTNICKVAARVLLHDFPRCHYRREGRDSKSLREDWYIPKILGLDFVMDKNRRPWLVEVNRFCGLEPRDETDRKIKFQVVRDAWRKAGELRPFGPRNGEYPFGDLLDHLPCARDESCLKRLTLDNKMPII